MVDINGGAVRNFTHGQVTIKDGAGREFLVLLDEGNLTLTERKEAKTIMSRGKTNQFARGVEEPIPISFSAHFSEYFSKDRGSLVANDISLRDALSGDYNGAVSVSDCGPFQTRLEFFLESPCKTGIGDKDETLFFEPFVLDEKAFAEEEESDKLTFTGKALRNVPNDNVPLRVAV